jgi:hypothetical protein
MQSVISSLGTDRYPRSRLLRCVVIQQLTILSEEHTSSSFKAEDFGTATQKTIYTHTAVKTLKFCAFSLY